MDLTIYFLPELTKRSTKLRPIPFTTAVDLNENRKYLRYLLPLLLLTTAIVVVWPQIIKKSATRLVNYQTYYEKEMPFQFNIQNKDLMALQTEDYRLEVKITGDEVPNEVFIEVNGIAYKLEKENNILFHYTFSNVQSTTDFQLSAAGFLSKEYELKVLPKPSLLQFNLQLVYPSYLNKPNETLANTGDLQIPQGTKVNWVFNTKNTDELTLKFMDSLAFPKQNKQNQFSFSRKFMQNNNYTIKALNQFVGSGTDSVNYNISVIADQFPGIDVSEKADSLNPKNIYFSGQLKDDYGFSRLTFYFKKFSTDTNGKATETNGSYPIAISKTQISQPYFYFFDASQYDLSPGDKVEYYFEVFDNDGVNGPKASKTQLMVFKAPTLEEINESTQKNNTEIKKDLEESIKKAKQLQKDVNDLAKKINDKKQLGYEEKKKLEDLVKKQQELQNKVDEVKKENEQNNKQQSEFSQTDESIMEKQKQLEQLFENVMTPEMKKLFDELNKMLEKMDKNQVQEKLEQLKLTNEDIEKELDRNLEAFKQLEVQQKMQNAIDKLDELQKKEEALNKETEGKKPEDKSDKKEDKAGDKNQDQKNAENKKLDEKGEKNPDSKSPDNKNRDNKNDKKGDPKDLEKKAGRHKKRI